MQEMIQNGKAPSGESLHNLLVIAGWFGLAAGLLEGATFWILQTTGLLAWRERYIPIDLNIVWASTLVDLLLFLFVAVILLPLVWLLRRFRWEVGAAVVFATMAFYSFLSVSGRLRERAAVILALGLGVTLGRWMGRNPKRGTAWLRRTVVPLAILALLAGISVIAGQRAWEKIELARLPAPPPGAPNVLLIVLDTLRADRLGTYGYPRPTTPFLDNFAQQSVLFEKAFANAPWTLPSHTSLFTGRMPYEHGAILWHYDGRFATLAQVLASRGYATAGFVANGGMGTHAAGLDLGFQRWENIFTGPMDTALRTVYGRKFRKYVLYPYFAVGGDPHEMRAEEVNWRFLRWLQVRPNRPFFVFLNYMEMHSHFTAPPEFAARFSAEPWRIRPPSRIAFRSKQWNYQGLDASKRDKILNDAYDAALCYLDAQLKILFDELHRRHLDDNLLVIITSDHGESLGEHRLYDHRNGLYFQQIHVPLIVHFAPRIPAGRRVSAVVGLKSLPATVAELTGFGSNPFPGPSLVACWSEGSCGDGVVLSEVAGAEWPDVPAFWPIRQGWVKSLISPQWHFLLQQHCKVELFDWQNDPQELRNLAQTPEGSPMAERLRAKLAESIPEARAALGTCSGF